MDFFKQVGPWRENLRRAIMRILFHSTRVIEICLHMLYTTYVCSTPFPFINFSCSSFRCTHSKSVFQFNAGISYSIYPYLMWKSSTEYRQRRFITMLKLNILLGGVSFVHMNSFSKTTNFELKRTSAFSSRRKNTLISQYLF